METPPPLGWYEWIRMLGNGCPGIHTSTLFKSTRCMASQGICPLRKMIYTCRAVIGYEKL